MPQKRYNLRVEFHKYQSIEAREAGYCCVWGQAPEQRSRKELSAEIEGAHFGYVNIRQRERQTFDRYRCVFNTVPALVLDAKWLQCFSLSVRIYDIATSPGGTDFSYCKEHGISAGLFPGIPGKMYPEEAGRIIVSGIVEQETAIMPPSE